MDDEERYQSALRTLGRFRKWVADQATEKVISREDDLQQPFGGGEEVIERYGHLMLLTNQLMQGIHFFSSSGRPPPPPITKVDEIRASEEHLAERLGEWFKDNPGVVPVSVQVLPADEGEDCRALIVHAPLPSS